MKLNMPIICLVLFAALAVGLQAAENIYPDPSFESTGEKGAARTGERAGHLKVEGQQHWLFLGGPITVKPYSTYRATAYVKGTAGTGEVSALFCWTWDSFLWSFQEKVFLKSSSDWQKAEITFVSPNNYMHVLPLGFMDAANSDLWVDDVTVEKIKGPEETIASLEAKKTPTGNDIRVLARYYVSKSREKDARALMADTDDMTKADIACVIGFSVQDHSKRKPVVAEFLRYGGLGYPNGWARFSELTAGMTVKDRIEIASIGMKVNPSRVEPGNVYRDELTRYIDTTKKELTCAETEKLLRKMQTEVKPLALSLPEESAARKAADAVLAHISTAQKDLAKQQASLGKCVISIGGKKVTPQTHAIAIPVKPTLQEKHAAKDLQVHLELLTGSLIPIVNENKLASHTPIVVGKCALLNKLKANVDFKSLGIEGLVIKTVGPVLILTGNKRGVLYATYSFLEDYLNCRWLTHDCSVIPKKGNFNIKDINRRYIPPLEYRMVDPPYSYEANWNVRNRLNGQNSFAGEEHGGKISYRGFVHTFHELVPPHIYAAKHPEYYTNIDGKPADGSAQLCLTNPEVLNIATESVKRWFKESPEATVVSVSQNDCWGYCQCKNCAALIAKEESPAGPIIHFVNAIADAIKDEYPEKIIDTLAYQYSRKPPKYVKPRPNVAVRLCSIECCFSHPLGSCPVNKSFVDDIEKWSKLSNRLYIWDYVINYGHSVMPHPNLYSLKPNINFFVKNGVAGIYEEGPYFCNGTELSELRTYVLAKTLWDPNYDTDKAIDEFVNGYYGGAARYIRQYVDLIHKPVLENPHQHLFIGSPPWAGHITPEILGKAADLFDQAESAVVNDPVLLQRVQVARLPLIFSQTTLLVLDYKEQGDKLVPKEGADISALKSRFEKAARAVGLNRISEPRWLDHWLGSLPAKTDEIDIVRLRNSSLELSILPQRGGRIFGMKYLPAGKDVLKRYNAGDTVRPTLGGYSEYSSINRESVWWADNYKVLEQTDHSVKLEGNLHNGPRLTRTIELDSDRAKVHVMSVLTNPGDKPMRGNLCVRPVFEAPDASKCEMQYLQTSGGWRKMPLATKKGSDSIAGLQLNSRAIPTGQWILVNKADGIGIINTFDPNQVKQCKLNWSNEESWAQMELLSPDTEIQPGQSITIKHSYEIMDLKK